jgi:hypothetical protein
MIPGVGAKGAADAAAWIGGKRERLLDFGSAPLRGRGGRSGAALQGLAGLLARICGEDDEMGDRPSEVARYYAPLMKGLYPDDYPDREEEVQELCGMAEESGSLSAFLADVTLDPPNTVSSGSGDGERRDVTLSTIHSAKGLEWGRVFLLSATEGRLPSSYAMFNDDEMEEERRLFYVAVTRAKDELYVMCPSEISGWDGAVSAKPTRFLSGLPAGTVDVIRKGRKLAYRKLFPEAPAPVAGDGGFADEDAGWGPGFSVDSGQEAPSRRSGAASGRTAPAPVRPSPEERVSEPVKGERVRHQTFGEGTVMSFKDGKAVIDFDACGRKTIACRHARLFRVVT